MKTDRLYFLAIIPPEEISQQLWEIKKQVARKYNSNAALRSPPHITIHMPFRSSMKKLERLSIRLTKFCEQYQQFPIDLNGFGSFPPRVIYVKVESNARLTAFQEDVRQFMVRKMSLHDANYRSKPFRPHITIAFRDLKKAQFHLAWEFFKAQTFSASYLVDRLYLLSHNGRQWEPEDHFDLRTRV